MLIKVIVPRFKKQRRYEVLLSRQREPLWKVAEWVAKDCAYPAGTNYSFALEGKSLNPEKAFEHQASDGDLLFLLIH